MSSDEQEAPQPEATPESARTRWSALVQWMFEPEASAGLAIYRMLWGSLMAWESWRYLAAGWVRSYYDVPNVLFKYIGFEWVDRLPPGGMNVVYVIMIVSGVMVALGLLYRLASAVFFVLHTYAFLLAASNYLNHAYLIALLALIMVFLPAHRTWSLDAVLWKKRASDWIPRWPRALLLAQLTIVYMHGGIAKLNMDWLGYQQPIRVWMKGSAKRVPPMFSELVASEPFAQFVTYGGVLFDLFIAPALLWRKTRPFAVIAAASFHISNMHLFSIGVFPWFMLAATTLFFVPDWPRRVPGLGKPWGRALDWFARASSVESAGPQLRQRVGAVVVTWLVLQALIPFRHHFYPGDVAWNEDGHYCSWRMKLRSKKGSVKFRVVDRATGRSWIVDPSSDLSKRQARKIRGKPELIRQYAHVLVERYREEEERDVEVYVDAFASLNYRKVQRFIDPKVDLGHTPASLGPYRWVLPFTWTEPPHPK